MKLFQSVRSKIAGGFSLVLVSLAVVAVLGIFSLHRSSDGFTQYRSWALETYFASQVEADMLMVRLHAAKYISSGSKLQLDKYLRYQDRTLQTLRKAREEAEEDDKKFLLDAIIRKVDRYHDAFLQVAGHFEDQVKFVDSGLKILGPEIVKGLSGLQATFSDDHSLYTNFASAMHNLVTGRLYAARFTIFNSKSESDRALAEFDEMNGRLSDLSDRITSAEDLIKIKKVLSLGRRYSATVLKLVDTVNARNLLVAGTVDELGPDIIRQIGELKDDIKSSQDALGPALEAKNKETQDILIFLSILSIFVGAVAVWYISRSVMLPIVQGMVFAQAIADGDLSQRFLYKGRDEFGRLARALNQMAEELARSTWIKNGQAEIDALLRDNDGVDSLTKESIAFYVKYLEANLGALYLVDDEGYLNLTASYAFSDRRGNFNRIKIGEGLVGQAGLEMETICFSDTISDAPPLNYGAGEKIPPHWLIVPIVFHSKLVGVLQVGSLQPFSKIKTQLLKESIQSVATALVTGQSRARVEELLELARESQERLREQQTELQGANEELENQAEALRQSESRLQTQQEELRATNEELEEQTSALRQSEGRLQAQQEELRVANEELTERSKLLEKNRDAIQQSNSDLELARSAVEEKARDLEMASQYKSEFLANMSHELRTPLNSILILSTLLMENKGKSLSEKEVHFADNIHSSGEDLLILINEILDLSKVEAGKMEVHIEPMRLRRFAEDLHRKFSHIAEDKRLGFEVEVAPEIPETILTDEQKVQQIITNLLSNAIKFTERGGVTVRLGGSKDEGSVTIAVIDTGIGIPEDKQALVFESFRQVDGATSRKFGGSGLGLSISKQFATLLGGEITMTSESGKGATFTLSLPAIYREDSTPPREVGKPEAKQVAVVTPEGPGCSAPEKGLVVDDRLGIEKSDTVMLIVEDDPKFAQILLELARGKGFKAIVAEDGESGLHYADYYQPSGIILDVGLPGLDGWSVMERLKGNAHTRHIPVHFISGAEQANRAMKMGAVGYLKKPVEAQEVVDAMVRIEDFVSRPTRNLLIVDDDLRQCESIMELIGNGDVHSKSAHTGREALEMLRGGSFDCLILDLGLSDISGFELLELIRKDKAISWLPIIVYTGKALTIEEQEALHRYTDSIIIKDAAAPGKLFEETNLFLHRLASNIPEEKLKLLEISHDREVVFLDKKILVVDDDMRNVYALTSILEEKGMVVVEGLNGREGLLRLEENPDVDLVLMDIMMPELDGYDTMREIRKKNEFDRLPIIALTAKAMKGDRTKCIEAGANDYLPKPVDTEKLFSLLRVWMYQ